MGIFRFSNRNQGVPRDFFDGGSGAIPRTQWKMRRDTNANRLLCTPANGEPFWATDTQLLYVGDGSTAGGILIAGAGSDSYKVKITANDTTAQYLQASLVAGTGITLTLNNSGANETLTVAATATGDVVGPSSSVDNQMLRWNGTTGKLIQGGQITESDTGDMAGVASITGTRDSGSYDNWETATVYVVDDNVVTTNPEGGLASYVCILNHTSEIDRDWPGYGEEWATYWEPLDEILHVTGPFVIDDNVSLNRGQLRHVSLIRFTGADPAQNENLQISTPVGGFNENARWRLPFDEGFEGAALMVDAQDGNESQLYWGVQAFDTIADTPNDGECHQVRMSDGAGTSSWDRIPLQIGPAWKNGLPGAGEVVFLGHNPHAVFVPEDFLDSPAIALVGSTLEKVYTIAESLDHGATFTTIGTVTFAAAGQGGVQEGVWASVATDDFTIQSNTLIRITAPASQDATLSGVTMTIRGFYGCDDAPG